MTANEKLQSAGLYEQFVEAVKNRDRTQMIRLFRQVDISLGDARWLSGVILDHPERYGFHAGSS